MTSNHLLWQRCLTLLIALLLPFWAAAQQIQVVSVNASGFGKTESEALLDAVVNGIAQVNGESIASSMRVSTKASSSSDGKEGSSTMTRNIEEDISRKTKGVVQSWRKISSERSPAGDYAASASVNVYVLKRSEQLKRMKLAVVPSRGGDANLTIGLVDEVTKNLTTSRKFALMDRKNASEVESQLSRIRKGGSLEDSVRLSAEVAPDFIAVVSVNMTSRPDGRQTAFGSLEVIDYSTRQIKLSEKKSISLKTGDDTSNARRIAMLGKGLSRAVIQTVFPPTVLGEDGGFITIGQGSDFFSVGDQLVVKKMGATLRDPHTGEYLSQDQSDVGSAVVSYVDSRISRAKLASKISLDPNLLAKQRYQVWRTGETEGDLFGGSAFAKDGDGAAASGKKGKKMFATGDDDDD
ncbi:MAG: hypothetical protein EBQ76_01720 [Betaproteobacteria bacterium]|nr:hypothetical protein [Betaproteobacteria bacterium]